jgi:hypothetical protein
MTSEANRIGSLGIKPRENPSTVGLPLKVFQENDDGFDGLVYIRSKKIAPKDPENRTSILGFLLEDDPCAS